MDNIKDFTIATVFILVCSTALLFFALGYPALNNQQSVLVTNPAFNQTAQDLATSLGGYQSAQNQDINISVSDDPQASAEGLYLVSTTATSRNLFSRLTESFKLITTLLGNVFGLSGGQFALISGALLSLFGFVAIYYVIKVIRWGQ